MAATVVAVGPVIPPPTIPDAATTPRHVTHSPTTTRRPNIRPDPSTPRHPTTNPDPSTRPQRSTCRCPDTKCRASTRPTNTRPTATIRVRPMANGWSRRLRLGANPDSHRGAIPHRLDRSHCSIRSRHRSQCGRRAVRHCARRRPPGNLGRAPIQPSRRRTNRSGSRSRTTPTMTNRSSMSAIRGPPTSPSRRRTRRHRIPRRA